jgi:preprotein translocase subunit SecD
MNTRRAGILLVLLLAVAGGGFAVWHFFLRSRRPDFEQVGGTLLVYRVACPPEIELKEGTKVSADVLAARLEGLATAKVTDDDQIEIRIPRTDQHAEEVGRAKEIAATVGHLEFVILANSHDDARAIEDAKRMLNEDDPAMKKKLTELQVNGGPPPDLVKPGDNAPTVYAITVAKGQKCRVTYRWVELGPQERASLRLDEANPAGDDAGQPWHDARKNLGKAAVWREFPDRVEGLLAMNGALFYSRECKNRHLKDDAARAKKAVDYFVLAREPEMDENGVPAPRLDGGYLKSATSPTERDGHWAVGVSFDAQGAGLLREMTKKNVPDGPEDEKIRRHLAIVVDGQVLSAPTISSVIGGGHAQITGRFNEAEMRHLAAILRGGKLAGPTTLVEEKEVPPKARP